MKKSILIIIVFICFSLIIKAQIPTNGLTGYWPFSGSQFANDYSGNGNNGVINGATLTNDRFGNCNQAYKFDGISNYILVPNSPTVDMNNTDFTISFWIKTYRTDTNGIPLCKNVYGSWSGYFFCTNSSNPGYCTNVKHAFFYAAAGYQQQVCSDSAVCKDTTWHFLTGIYNHSTNKSYFYVDAVLQSAVGQASGSPSNNQDLAFGAHNIGTTLFFTGALDAIRFYKRVLNNAEIIQLYNEVSPGSINGNGYVKDTTVCSSLPIILNGGAASSYTWSTGNNTQTISVNSTNTYWVQTQINYSCQQTDTIHVNFVVPPVVNLLKDTSVCSNVGYILNASYVNATSYNWSTSATGSSISPFNTGIYWVDISVNSCVVRDSMRITLLSSPVLNLVKDTFICSTPITLNIKDTSLVVNWSTGSNSNQVILNSIGSYTVSTMAKNGCITIATVNIKNMESNTSFTVPNIITPNEDGINDYFEFNIADIIVKEFKIYDRWGKLIYSTINTPVKWNGKQADNLVDDGTYYWIALFNSTCNNAAEDIKQKGFLTVFK